MSGDIRTFNSFIKKILELERGVAGRSRWDNNSKMDVNLSLLCLVFSVLFSSYMLITTKSSITIGGEVSSADALIYS